MEAEKAADDDVFARLWQQAFDAYKAESGHDLIKESALLQDLPTVDALEAYIQQTAQSNAQVRNKHRIWAVLRTSIGPLEKLTALSKTVAGIGISGCMPAGVILGAVTFLLDAAKGVSEAYDNIADLLGQLEYFTWRFVEYVKGKVDVKMQRIAVEILTVLLLIFARSEKLIREGRFKTYARTAFLGEDKKVKSYLNRLRGLVDGEMKMATSIILATTQRVEVNTEEIMSSLRDTKNLNIVKEALDSTAVAKAARYQGKYSEQRLTGTCEWINGEPLYKHWLEGTLPILWILGGPGAGKSCLSSAIISHLHKLYPQDPEQASLVSLGYFYVREDENQIPSVSTILKTFAFQMASNNAVYHNYLATRVCNSLEKISSETSLWQYLFMDFFSSEKYYGRSASLVIDGLDEGANETRETLLRFFGEIEMPKNGQSRPRIRMALVGRPELGESAYLIWGRHIDYVPMTTINNSKDIITYVKKSLQRVQILNNSLMKASPKAYKTLARRIFQKLVDNANGMFLWVRLMIDQISSLGRPELIYEALDTAPPGLESMIRHIFERLARDPSVSDGIEDLNEILAWVSCTRRPLLLGEMHILLRLRSRTGEAMYMLEDNLKGSFASFFTLSDDQDIFEEGEGFPDIDLKSDGADEEDPKGVSDIDLEMLGGEDDDSDEDEQPSSASGVTLVEKLESSSSADRLLPVRFKTTVIKFSHASIRDFLLKEGTPEKRQAPSRLKIGFEVGKAEQHITETCLALIQESESVRKGSFEASSITNYAAQYFMSHLIAIDRSTLSEVEKASIKRRLLAIFYKREGISSWLENIRDHEQFFNDWFGDRRYVDCVGEWFGDRVGSEGSFSNDERAYVATATNSVKGLLRPMAEVCATRWLTNADVDADASFYIWFLHIYSRLIDNDSWYGIQYQPQVDRIGISKISQDELYTLAGIFQFKKSSCWHGRLACTLRDVGYLDAAIMEFQNALDVEEARVWLIGLAQCYAKSGNYSTAITWGQKALAAISNDEGNAPADRADTYQQISTWYLHINEIKMAIASAREAFHLDRENIMILVALVKSLYVGKQFVEMIDLLNAYFENFSSTSQTSVLNKTSKFEITRMIAIASAAIDRRDFVEKLLRKAVAEAEESKDYFHKEQYKYHLGSHLINPPTPTRTAEAISLLEQVFESVKDKKYTSALWILRKEAQERLSQLYFHKATQAEQAGGDSNQWISKLETLSNKSGAGLRRGFKRYSTNDASLMLGLWHSTHGNRKQAKECLRDIVLQAIDLLRDSDPTNDIAGYKVLAQAFMFFQDEINAVAAFSLVNAPLEKLQTAKSLALANRTEDKTSLEQSIGLLREYSFTEGVDNLYRSSFASSSRSSLQTPLTPETPASNRLSPGPRRPSNRSAAAYFPSAESLEDQIKTWNPSLFWECKGRCNQDAISWKTVHFCTQCIRRVYCDKCLELFKQGTLPLVAPCSIDHALFQIYPLKNSIEDVESVKIAGERLGRTEWLAKLRREWMDDDKVPLATAFSDSTN